MVIPDSENPRRWHANADTWLAISTIMLGLAIWLLVPHQVDEPPSFFGQTNAGLDPKLFPQIAAAGFVIIGILYLVASFRMPGENHFRGLNSQTVVSLGIVLMIMIAYVALLRPLGFVISSGLVGLAVALLYGSRNIIGIFSVSIVAPVSIYLMFTRLLSVSLPPIPGVGQ